MTSCDYLFWDIIRLEKIWLYVWANLIELGDFASS